MIGETHIPPERACIPEFGWKHAKKMQTSGETEESRYWRLMHIISEADTNSNFASSMENRSRVSVFA